MPGSATAGATKRAVMIRLPTDAVVVRLVNSLAGRLIVVAIVFLAVPVLVYSQFREADLRQQDLLQQSALQQGRIIARALRPVLEAATPETLPRLGAELAPFADQNLGLKLLLRPASVPRADGFFYVAAAPTVSVANLEAERRQLIDQGVFDRLAGTCAGNEPLALRIPRSGGGQELLTSITPVNTRYGCWALVTAHAAPGYLDTSIGQPYWRKPEVQAAALIYLAMAAIVLAVIAGIWRSLHRFGELARRIATAGPDEASFADRNTVPELESVAEDFDRLVATLRASADSIRRAAEDNAHALKTPIAVIRQSLEPLKRIVPAGDKRGQRAMDMIERSVDRLDGLVSYARKLDEEAADLLSVPIKVVDAAAVTRQVLEGYAAVLAGRGARLEAQLPQSLLVRAADELLETVLENLLENAAGFSPPGGTVLVRLGRQGDRAVLRVEDEGPGVPPHHLDKIFERYFSHRNGNAESDAPHFGIGLWIVRRNVGAVGGRVTARNRPTGGLAVEVVLPLAEARTMAR